MDVLTLSSARLKDVTFAGARRRNSFLWSELNELFRRREE
jgi:hypothetical protein